VLPQPHELTEREKEDAMGAYLMMFAAWGAGFPLPMVGLIASVIYFYLNKKSSPFTAFHSYQGLLTHIPISLLNAAAVIWGIVLVLGKYSGHFRIYAMFCVFAGIWNALYMVYSIIACIKARKGRFYYFWVLAAFVCEILPGAGPCNSDKQRAEPAAGGNVKQPDQWRGSSVPGNACGPDSRCVVRDSQSCARSPCEGRKRRG